MTTPYQPAQLTLREILDFLRDTFGEGAGVGLTEAQFRALAAALLGPLVVNAPDTGPTIDARSTGYYPAVNAQNDGPGPGIYCRGGADDAALSVYGANQYSAAQIENSNGSGLYVSAGTGQPNAVGATINGGNRTLDMRGSGSTIIYAQMQWLPGSEHTIAQFLAQNLDATPAVVVEIDTGETDQSTGLLLSVNGVMCRVRVGENGTGPNGGGRMLYID